MSGAQDKILTVEPHYPATKWTDSFNPFGAEYSAILNSCAEKKSLLKITMAKTTWAYDQVSQRFDKVKSEFEIEGGSMGIIPEERYQEVFTIMADHFVPDEPLCNGFGVKWEDCFQKIVDGLLRENVSVMMVSKDTNEIMGIRISAPMYLTDDNSSLTTIPYEPLRNLFKFITQKDDSVNMLKMFGLESAMHFFALGVHKKYRQRGLGTKLMGACIALSRELGYKAIKGEGTSNYSQRIYAKYGFEVICELKYDEFMHEGKPLREKTGVHTMTKIVAKKLE